MDENIDQENPTLPKKEKRRKIGSWQIILVLFLLVVLSIGIFALVVMIWG